MSKSIVSVCKNHIKKSDNKIIEQIFLVENVPDFKHEKIINYYNIPKNEQLIAFLDGTFFLSTKNGLAITSAGIYWKNKSDPSIYCLTYEDLRKAEIKATENTVNGIKMIITGMDIDIFQLIMDISQCSEEDDIESDDTVEKKDKIKYTEEIKKDTATFECAYIPAVYKHNAKLQQFLPKFEKANSNFLGRKFTAMPLEYIYISTCQSLGGYNYVKLDEDIQIVLDEYDKSLRHFIIGTHLKHEELGMLGLKEIFCSWLNLGVFITDARIIFCDPSYSEGVTKSTWTGWGIGGIAAALTLNAVSSISASLKLASNSSNIAIGHLRFEWISSIGYLTREARKTAWTHYTERNSIKIEYIGSNNKRNDVYITFNRDVNVQDIANDILHRICCFRLAMNDIKEQGSLDFYYTYANPANRIINDEAIMYDGGYSSIKIPSSFNVDCEAYLPDSRLVALYLLIDDPWFDIEKSD